MMTITMGFLVLALGCEQTDPAEPAVTPPAQTSTTPTNPAVIANTQQAEPRGFDITFPDNWQLSRDKMGMALIGAAPLDGPSDVFTESISINEIDNPLGLDLQDFYAQQFQLDVARERLTNFQLVAEVNQIINGQPAKRTVYTHRVGRFDLTAIVYTFVSPTNGYVITCTAEDAWLRQYQQRFEDIINTFHTL